MDDNAEGMKRTSNDVKCEGEPQAAAAAAAAAAALSASEALLRVERWPPPVTGEVEEFRGRVDASENAGDFSERVSDAAEPK